MNKQKIQTKLNIIHWNCFKMTPNRSAELDSFIKQNKPDIISLNEVKLEEYSANYYLNFENYKTIYKPRQKGSNFGGGVALLIKDQIEFMETNFFSSLKLELVEIKIKIEKKDCIIISYYNPPDQEPSMALFSALSRGPQEYLICGDLNSKSESFGCQSSNKNGKILENIIINNNCLIINEKAITFHRTYNNYADLLDLFICSPMFASFLNEYNVLECQELGSDHIPIQAIFNVKPLKCEQLKQNEMRFDFKRADWSKFKQEIENKLRNSKINTSLKAENIESINKFMLTTIIQSAIESIPQFKFKTNGQTLPNDILKIIKERRLVRAEIRKHNRQEDKTTYNKLKKQITTEISKLRDQAWQNFIQKCNRNPLSSRPFWQKINKIRFNKSNKNIPTLIHNDMSYETDLEKANLFSSLLKNIFSNCPDDQTDVDFNEEVENKEKKRAYSNNVGKNFRKITFSELKITLNELKLGTCPGEDHISNELLKQLPSTAQLHLLNLINLSLECCYLPDSWKLAKITMIPKKQINEDPSNYRSISLTSCLGKLIEKIIQKRLYTFVEKNRLLCDEQSGFRKHRRTCDNLIYLTQKIKENFNRKSKKFVPYFLI